MLDLFPFQAMALHATALGEVLDNLDQVFRTVLLISTRVEGRSISQSVRQALLEASMAADSRRGDSNR
jgi:hypothetical protein